MNILKLRIGGLRPLQQFRAVVTIQIDQILRASTLDRAADIWFNLAAFDTPASVWLTLQRKACQPFTPLIVRQKDVLDSVGCYTSNICKGIARCVDKRSYLHHQLTQKGGSFREVILCNWGQISKSAFRIACCKRAYLSPDRLANAVLFDVGKTKRASQGGGAVFSSQPTRAGTSVRLLRTGSVIIAGLVSLAVRTAV